MSNKTQNKSFVHEGKILNPVTNRWIKDTKQNRSIISRENKIFNPLSNRYVMDTPENRIKIAQSEFMSIGDIFSVKPKFSQSERKQRRSSAVKIQRVLK